MTGAVVVAGEALIDLVPDAARALVAHPGGGPFNAARAAARLEAPAAFLGRLSTDAFGARLRATLLEDGVDLGPAVTTDDPSTLALVELDAAAVATYRFYTDGTGRYVEIDRAVRSAPLTYDEDEAARLWRDSAALTGLAAPREALAR